MRTAFTTPVVVALGFVATAIFAQPVVISPEGQKAGAPDVAINAKGQLAILWLIVRLKTMLQLGTITTMIGISRPQISM